MNEIIKGEQNDKCKKASFINERLADEYIKKLKKTSNRSVKPHRAYLCPICFCWHLTSYFDKEDMKLVYKEREIVNLKNKIASLESKIKELQGLRPIINAKYVVKKDSNEIFQQPEN